LPFGSQRGGQRRDGIVQQLLTEDPQLDLRHQDVQQIQRFQQQGQEVKHHPPPARRPHHAQRHAVRDHRTPERVWRVLELR